MSSPAQAGGTRSLVTNRWNHRAEAQESDSSSAIDRVPHRPPSPLRDFEGYNRYIAGLSPSEYDALFFIPLPREAGSESGSEVNSNERFVRDFVGPNDVDVEDRAERTPVNTNNTIGSREASVIELQRMTMAATNFERQAMSAIYVDDQVSVREDERTILPDNDAYLQAAGSSEQVVIPSRAPTVPPPPVTHRVPRLEDQDPAFRARQREMFALFRTGAIRQESSHESNESTDSGEYTIRDGSTPSSGHHHSSRGSSQANHGSVPSSPTVSAAIGIVTAITAASLPQAEGATHQVSFLLNPPEDGGSHTNWILGFGILVGWIVGVATTFCCVKSQTEIKVESSVELVQTPDDRIHLLHPRGEWPNQPIRRRRRHNGTAVFLTPNGDCVHLSEHCSTVRNSRAIIKRHMCTVCAEETTHAPRNA